MGEKKQDVFALIYESGRAETVVGGGMGSGPLSDYWAVLDRIATTFNSSGFSSDHPTMLFRNGQPVHGRPIDLATRYLGDVVRERDAALKRVREKHRPDWMEASTNG